jgi:hypothetical protein
MQNTRTGWSDISRCHMKEETYKGVRKKQTKRKREQEEK